MVEKQRSIASKPRKLCDAGGLIIDKHGVTSKLCMEGISELVVKQFWCFSLKHFQRFSYEQNIKYAEANENGERMK